MLNQDEFFVLGDNSPNSEDGRWWGEPDIASKGWTPPRAGVVPRYYLVGRALFVYWPSGFGFPWPQSLKTFLGSNRQNAALRLLNGLVTLRWVPNVGQIAIHLRRHGQDRADGGPRTEVQGDIVDVGLRFEVGSLKLEDWGFHTANFQLSFGGQTL